MGEGGLVIFTVLQKKAGLNDQTNPNNYWFHHHRPHEGIETLSRDDSSEEPQKKNRRNEIKQNVLCYHV